ncbi:hypothetical protein FRX31_013924, partial [Thalictrum thalictroides]
MVKDDNFWTMEIPEDCSWVWRNVLKTRHATWKNTKVLITKGLEASHWNDPWTILGPLAKHPDIVSCWGTIFQQNAKVEELLNHGQWDNNLLNSLDVQKAQLIKETTIHN